MQAQILNLDYALQLASIIYKYVDLDEIDKQQDALTFIQNILDKIQPDEYIYCVSIMTDTTEEYVKKQIPIEVLAEFIEGLELNKIISLLAFCKSIGF